MESYEGQEPQPRRSKLGKLAAKLGLSKKGRRSRSASPSPYYSGSDAEAGTPRPASSPGQPGTPTASTGAAMPPSPLGLQPETPGQTAAVGGAATGSPLAAGMVYHRHAMRPPVTVTRITTEREVAAYAGGRRDELQTTKERLARLRAAAENQASGREIESIAHEDAGVEGRDVRAVLVPGPAPHPLSTHTPAQPEVPAGADAPIPELPPFEQVGNTPEIHVPPPERPFSARLPEQPQNPAGADSPLPDLPSVEAIGVATGPSMDPMEAAPPPDRPLEETVPEQPPSPAGADTPLPDLPGIEHFGKLAMGEAQTPLTGGSQPVLREAQTPTPASAHTPLPDLPTVEQIGWVSSPTGGPAAAAVAPLSPLESGGPQGILACAPQLLPPGSKAVPDPDSACRMAQPALSEASGTSSYSQGGTSYSPTTSVPSQTGYGRSQPVAFGSSVLPPEVVPSQPLAFGAAGVERREEAGRAIPTAAVGGTSGMTHMGGPADLAAGQQQPLSSAGRRVSAERISPAQPAFGQTADGEAATRDASELDREPESAQSRGGVTGALAAGAAAVASAASAATGGVLGARDEPEQMHGVQEGREATPEGGLTAGGAGQMTPESEPFASAMMEEGAGEAPGQGIPLEMDRRIEHEVIVVPDGSGEQPQEAPSNNILVNDAYTPLPEPLPSPQHIRAPAGSEGSEPPASPGEPLGASEPATPADEGLHRRLGPSEQESAVEGSVPPAEDQQDMQREVAAEAPLSASVAAPLEGAAAAATEAGEAVKDTAQAGVERAAETAGAAKDAVMETAAEAQPVVAQAADTAASAKDAVVEKAGGAASTAGSTVSRMAAAVGGAAAAVAGAVASVVTGGSGKEAESEQPTGLGTSVEHPVVRQPSAGMIEEVAQEESTAERIVENQPGAETTAQSEQLAEQPVAEVAGYPVGEIPSEGAAERFATEDVSMDAAAEAAAPEAGPVAAPHETGAEVGAELGVPGGTDAEAATAEPTIAPRVPASEDQMTQRQAEAGANVEAQASAGGGSLTSGLMGAAAAAAAAVSATVGAVLGRSAQSAEQDVFASPTKENTGVDSGGGTAEESAARESAAAEGQDVELAGETSQSKNGEAGGETEGLATAAVTPVPSQLHQQTMKEAAEQGSAVDASLLQTLEGAEEPSTLSSEPGASAQYPSADMGESGAQSRQPGGDTSHVSATTEVLPVAVSPADQRELSEATHASPAVDASLATQQDAPGAAQAEFASRSAVVAGAAAGAPTSAAAEPLYRSGGSADEESELEPRAGHADLAGAELGQPEAVDAPSEYLRDREAARAHPEEEPAPGGLWEMQDLTGMEAPGLRAAAAPPLGVSAEQETRASLSKEHMSAEQGAGAGSMEAVTAAAARELEAADQNGGATAAEPAAPPTPGSALAVPAAPHTPLHLPATAEEGQEEEEEELSAEEIEETVERAVQQRFGGLVGLQTGPGGAQEPPPSPAISTSPDTSVAGATRGGGAGARQPPSRLQTSTTLGSSLPEEETPALEDVSSIAAAAPPDRMMMLLRGLITWGMANPVTAAGVMAVLPLLYMAANRAAVAAFGEFGPVLLLSGAVAIAASIFAWLLGWAGTPQNDLEMLREGATEAELAASVGGGGVGAGAATATQPAATFDAVKEDQEFLDASEPVSRESTEDLRRPSGALEAAREKASHATEHLLEAVEPGREQVGEVVQETESGDEVVEGRTGVEKAVDAVTETARAAAGKASELASRAYYAVAPGADVSGEGAPLKDLNDSGYESDSEEPGPVIQGVHHQTGTRADRAPHASTASEPGLLNKAAAVTGQLASSAAQSVKEVAAKATGTTTEQQQPGQQLAELQASIAQMEGERAQDVEFQKASQKLGM